MNDTQTLPALSMHRHYDAAPERVYAAWTDPSAAAIFMGPNDVQACIAEMDVRPGGSYRIEMLVPGGERIEVFGTYREVTPPRRLQMTWRWREDDPNDERDTLLTLDFTPSGGGTDLTLTHEQFPTDESRDRHRSGWSSIAEKLESFLTKGVCVGTDLEDGRILATVRVAASPERAFAALASPEVTAWWVRPGVFDTRTWQGDVRPGGRWEAGGIGRGHPYTMSGEFREVEAPRRLVHSWQASSGQATTVTYDLVERDGQTQIALRHDGFTDAATCKNTALAWESSLARLAQLLREAA